MLSVPRDAILVSHNVAHRFVFIDVLKVGMWYKTVVDFSAAKDAFS